MKKGRSISFFILIQLIKHKQLKNKNMKAQKLTPKQKELFDMLTSLNGGVLFKHVKPTGTICYRVLDNKRNPVFNVRCGLVDELIQKDVLEKVPNTFEYVLKATTENKIDVSKFGLVKA